MDYYKILNVKEDATLKEIEQSYQDLSSFYNPSNNTSKEAYRRYREINKAYLVLKENKQREMYNLIYNKKEEEVVKVNANMHSFNEFLKEFKEQEDINKFKDIVVEDEYDSYLKINLAIPYLYYLVNSEYLVSFNKEVIANQDGVCPVCLGLGKVKKNDKICKYFYIPIQHISNSVLKRMNRKILSI